MTISRFFVFVLLLPLLLASCQSSKELTEVAETQVVNLDTPIVVVGNRQYRATQPRLNDLLHTRLELEPLWASRELEGFATLTFTPYFYAQDTVVIDAKGMAIRDVQLLGADTVDLSYQYDSLQLIVHLPRTYTREDTFTLGIDYIARPYADAGVEGSLEDGRGLYFINPLGTEKGRPQQLWTQGEPEASSRWFPTIDQPNERMTQEIYITVDTAFETLSNGLLIYSTQNANGTRTDYWRQKVPDAPYLTALVVGDFAVVEDSWRDSVAVNYYVEPEYEQYAQMVFGVTPEMIEFYSNRLGVDFPWAKYHQIVVRDFVAGAMENSGAVIFYDALQHNDREHLDNPHEDIIAHELFHHWFGDLVTTESWANLALNESFATYGEVLWAEHKYGYDQAEQLLLNDYRAYMAEAAQMKTPLINFYYDTPGDMFNRHTYQKGGLTLHMLRKVIGDEAFFAALNTYLTENAYQSAEYHDLRLAFEEVTGQDLNWFFSQWFEEAGHPELAISYGWSDSLNRQRIVVHQIQDTSRFPIYRLPVEVDFYFEDTVLQRSVVVDEMMETLSFDFNEQPLLVNFDAEKGLLAEKHESKRPQEWYYQFFHAPLFMDRYEAIKGLGQLSSVASEDSLEFFFTAALKSDFWGIREAAISELGDLDDNWVGEAFGHELREIAEVDEKASVRASAIKLLSRVAPEQSVAVFQRGLQDSSYNVVATSLHALNEADPAVARAAVARLEDEKNFTIASSVARLYAVQAPAGKATWFRQKAKDYRGMEQLTLLYYFTQYLQQQSPTLAAGNISAFRTFGEELQNPQHKQILMNVLLEMQGHYAGQIEELEAQEDPDEQAVSELESVIEEIQMVVMALQEDLPESYQFQLGQ